jgi:hypothetical protein
MGALDTLLLDFSQLLIKSRTSSQSSTESGLDSGVVRVRTTNDRREFGDESAEFMCNMPQG